MAPPDVPMRRFRPDDLAAVGELIHRTIEASYAGVYSPRAIAHFHEHHTDGKIVAEAARGCLLVVERGGRLVATGALVGNEISRMYVEPACQRQGLGTAILRALEARALEAGLAELALYASVVAKPFYERLGYTVTEEGESDVGEGQALQYFRMAKPLAGPLDTPESA